MFFVLSLLPFGEKIAVGEVSYMPSIIKAMHEADKVIHPFKKHTR